jgi:hypothetical protein
LPGSGSSVAAPWRPGRIFLAEEMTGRCGFGRLASRRSARARLAEPAGRARCLVTGKQAPRRPGPDGRSSPLVRAGVRSTPETASPWRAPTGHDRYASLQDDAPTRSTTSTAAGTRRRVEPLTATAAVGLRPLPTRQVVTLDGPNPPVELVTIAAKWKQGPSSPAVPSTCRSIGVWRSHTDNSGRSGQAPELRHRRSIRVERVPGRAVRNRGPARMAFQHS